MLLNIAGVGTGLGILTLLVFGLLQWLHISTGHFLDWVIGVASFWWLLVIVTVPWNVHLEAREVLAEGSASRANEIAVDPKQLNYVEMIAKRSLTVAIALHVLSAVGLYILAATGISAVGYVSSGAALLLTALRPAVRFYQYLAARLRMIRQEFTYPRRDVIELQNRFEALERSVKGLQEQLDPEEPYSWVATHQRYWEETRKGLAQLEASMAQLEAHNNAEHQRLARDSENAIAQLTADSQFLDNVREIIRFFKTA